MFTVVITFTDSSTSTIGNVFSIGLVDNVFIFKSKTSGSNKTTTTITRTDKSTVSSVSILTAVG